MNRGECRDYTRFLLDDKSATLIADSDLNVLLNVGIDKVFGEIRKLKEDYFIKVGSLSTANNTRDYAFSLVGADVDKVRMIEKNSSPSYSKLRRIDWMKHKFEFSTTAEPDNFYIINGKIYTLPVPNAVYAYNVYYEQTITYPTADATAIPLIPVRYHDMIGIYAALVAKQHIAHYQKQAANMEFVIAMLADRKADLKEDLQGNRSEDVEIMAGVLGEEGKG